VPGQSALFGELLGVSGSTVVYDKEVSYLHIVEGAHTHLHVRMRQFYGLAKRHETLIQRLTDFRKVKVQKSDQSLLQLKDSLPGLRIGG